LGSVEMVVLRVYEVVTFDVFLEWEIYDGM
jgi:hypothetical protein